MQGHASSGWQIGRSHAFPTRPRHLSVSILITYAASKPPHPSPQAAEASQLQARSRRETRPAGLRQRRLSLPTLSSSMQLLLPALAAFSCLLGSAEAFLVPFAAPKSAAVVRMSSAPSASEAVMFSTNPLAGRKVQFSDSEDNDERVTQVQLNPDGTLSMISDNTAAIAIQGNWRPGVRLKV